MSDEGKTPEQIAAEAEAQREADAKADKAALAEAEKQKKDLEDTGDAVLDDGHSTVPIKQDPNDARKVIFKKASRNRETIIVGEAENNADVERVRAAIAEAQAKGTGNELDRTSDFDTNTDVQAREAARAAAAKPEGEEHVNDNGEGVDTSPKMVTVKVLGREFEVPAADVEEAGGLKAYQLERSAQERLRQAANREAELKAEREKLDEDRKKLEQQRESAGPASTAGPSSTPPGDAGNGDVAIEAGKIVDALYSGDRNATRDAIQKILARPGSEKIDAAEIARQAAALAKAELREQASAPAKTPEAPKPVDPAIEELNAYMAEKFADVLADAALREKALNEFNRLKALPENANRRLTDIGRDAGNFAKKSAPHPRQEVIEKKKALPPVSSGTQAHTPPAAPAAPSNSSHVARMRQARGLPTS